MYRTARIAAIVGCTLLAWGCNSTRLTPGVQPDSNPLTKAQGIPDTARPLPILQEIGHGTGDTIPAHPVFQPPVAKRIWRVGHRLNEVVWIGGYWMVVMYDRGRFAPENKGRAQIPVSPRLEDIPDKPKPETEKPKAKARPQEQLGMPSMVAPDGQFQVPPEASAASRAIAERLRQMQLGGGGQ